jgi:drug/metabolite transporter (DMT)-like permease
MAGPHLLRQRCLLLIPLLLIVLGQSSAKLAGSLLSEDRLLAALFVAGTYLVFALRGLLWAVIIKKYKLSAAYPVLSLSFPLVLLVSHLAFGEEITLFKLLGSAALVGGVLLVARGEAQLRGRR